MALERSELARVCRPRLARFLSFLLGADPISSRRCSLTALSVFRERAPPSSLLELQLLILTCSVDRHRWYFDLGLGGHRLRRKLLRAGLT